MVRGDLVIKRSTAKLRDHLKEVGFKLAGSSQLAYLGKDPGKEALVWMACVVCGHSRGHYCYCCDAKKTSYSPLHLNHLLLSCFGRKFNTWKPCLSVQFSSTRPA